MLLQKRNDDGAKQRFRREPDSFWMPNRQQDEFE